MNLMITDAYARYKNDILKIIDNFKTSGIVVGHGNRNTVKRFPIENVEFNFKSFKQHNVINRHVYKYYRKSKARRSFEYANLLLSKNFHTPAPVGYVEFFDFWGLTSSYYISEQLENCFPLSDVLYNHEFQDREFLIRKYAELIYNLHENGIEFIDNASGNFLIKSQNGGYHFYLVDLNRMNFHTVYEKDKRLSNFSRLTSDQEIISIVSAEYARLSGIPVQYCIDKINEASERTQRKRRLKQKLKFYKYFLKK